MLHHRALVPLFAFLFASVLPTVFGQNEIPQQNTTFLEGFIGFLQDSGYSNFTNALAQANETETGQTLLAELSSGVNWTIFAPRDVAFTNTSAVNASSDELAHVLAYHCLRGDLANHTFPSSGGNISSETMLSDVFPNVTVGRTQLNGSQYVDLEGNQSQALAWTRLSPDSPVFVLNQDLEGVTDNVTVGNTTRYENIIVNPIDHILVPPRSFISTLNSTNLTILGAILSQVPSPPGFFNGTVGNVTNTPNTSLAQAINDLGSNRTTLPGGYTLFAPNDSAFAQNAGVLQGLVSNISDLTAVFGNHLINGTTVYSPQMFGPKANETTYVSASGEPFAFFANETGRFVGLQSNTSAQAQIVRSDVLTNNGVIHIIDNVLVDTTNDTSAASSAFESATSVAAFASSSLVTLPIGFLPTSSVETTTTETPSATTQAVGAAHGAAHRLEVCGGIQALSVAVVMMGGAFGLVI